MSTELGSPDPSATPAPTDEETRPGSRRSVLSGRLPDVLEVVWRGRRLGAFVAATGAAAYGLVAGWWTPRGPITTTEALAAMGLSLLVGGFAGSAMRSRWAMLLAPVTFAVVFEITRIGAEGPTVDGIHLGSTYGIVAFVVGRGFHGVLALLPMLLGASSGAALGRRLSSDPARGEGSLRGTGPYARRVIAGLVGVSLVALALLVARPASTDAITGPDGEVLPGSVAELIRVDIGGHDLSMMIRGSSVDDPVLLFLAGGPGGTELGAMRNHGEALEQDFVVVTWDQRGTGKSYDQLEPVSTLTLEQAVADTVEVTNYLRDRFDEERIYLVGNSWGTILGVLAVQQHPELFHAFVGTGQMVSIRETDRPPSKDLIVFESSGHRPLFEQPDLFYDVMTQTVLAETMTTG